MHVVGKKRKCTDEHVFMATEVNLHMYITHPSRLGWNLLNKCKK